MLTSLIIFPFFFFLMLRRPPRSTLFPTRRSSDLGVYGGQCSEFCGVAHAYMGVRVFAERSEEHTSELQSRFDLVCRLLLEKKKNNKKQRYRHNHEIVMNFQTRIHIIACTFYTSFG